MRKTLEQMGMAPQHIERLLSFTTVHKIAKGTCFLKPDVAADSVYFLEQGLIRSYRLIEGEDLTYMFYFPNDFCVDFYAFLTNTPSQLYFDAMTDVVVHQLKKEHTQLLYNEIHEIERYGRLMAEKAFVIVSERFKDMQAMEAKDRYVKLMLRNPELLQQIPQKHIATYLNIKPESLSRIKSQLAGAK